MASQPHGESPTSGRMGRKPRWSEAALGRFAEGTLKRIKAVLKAKESTRDFIRAAVERELQRREKPKPK